MMEAGVFIKRAEIGHAPAQEVGDCITSVIWSSPGAACDTEPGQ
jgi:hypothetical protein